MIRLKAYAKLNLSLDVTGKRDDGYHELDGLMQSVSLFDVVTVEKSKKLSVTADTDVADEKSNSAYRAASAFLKLTKISGAKIHIEKRIPALSGLGGASADAAAALIGLDTLYGAGLGRKALLEIAQSIGADVPFALTGGTARAKGIGEKLFPVEIKKPMYYAVVKPFAGVSTADAFGRYRPGGRIDMDCVQSAVINGDAALFGSCAANALQPAAAEICPEIISAVETLLNAGARKAIITGSGSAVFCAVGTEEEARELIARTGSGFELCAALRPVSRGVEAI